MIRGVTVTVKVPTYGNPDRFGNPVKSFDPEDCLDVDDVLVVPGQTADLEASRPEGVQVAYSLHFPKSFTGDLEGCEVVLPEPWAGTYAVIGAPGPYIDADTPTHWHMPVEVEVAHG